MTTKEFKDKYPHYSHLEGNDLWNAMEDSLLQTGDSWTADYSDGYTEESSGVVNGITYSWRYPKYWINESTKERLSLEEYNSKQDPPQKTMVDQVTLESCRVDFIDFGQTPPNILYSENYNNSNTIRNEPNRNSAN